MNEEKKKKVRHQDFWNAPKTRLECDPNIPHNKWNPYEGEEFDLEYD